MGGNEVVFVSKAIAIRGVTLVTNYLSPLISTLFLIRNLVLPLFGGHLVKSG
jgi:hypothetical protein